MMGIYSYEEAFGAWDITSHAMRRAIDSWFSRYYGAAPGEQDPCQRVPYAVVSKLVRAAFGEYNATSGDPFCRRTLQALEPKARQAMELALVGGSCFLKPCPTKTGFVFSLIPRNRVLIFGRDDLGRVTDMGTVAHSTAGGSYYTLLERRTVDAKGMLTIQNRLYRSRNKSNLGQQVSLQSHPDYAMLSPEYRYPRPVGSIGLVELKTPMLNCVDGSFDGVSVYAPAMELIARIDENEAQLAGEYRRGESRILVSRDLLRPDASGNKTLDEHVFVGLDEDPEQVGITIFSPQLRYEAYLERKQEYLRNVESVIGLKRGMLSDANVDDRTATEISSSAGDYNLTVIEFQKAWQQAVAELLPLCDLLAALYRLPDRADTVFFAIDWGNGTLYDEDKTWEDYQAMVEKGLLKPEIALGWRFSMPTDTPQALAAIREKYMPQ